ncbi:MAG: serine hydrolase [Bacteroidota bacterium]
MTRSFFVLALALLTALPAFAQRQATLSRASADDIRQALRQADVRANLRTALRGASPTHREIHGHQINPLHTSQAVSNEGVSSERAQVRASRLAQRLSPAQARAILAEANVSDLDLSATATAAVPARLSTTATAGRTPVRTTPQRRTPQRTNPARTTTPAAQGAGGRVFVQPQGPQLDVLSFAAGLHDALKDDANGYVMRLAENGQPIATLQWEWARRPGDGGLGWNPQRRMHVASVSKLITAIAAVNLLHDKGISVDAPIGPYLPDYWDRGANVNAITFRELLTHRSGIEVPGSATSYSTMKAEIAAGVPSFVNSGQYENTNFGLFRILIPVINGDVSTDLMSGFAMTPIFESIADNVWDIVTVNAYETYVNQHVFSPSGVAGGPSLTHRSTDAIAYANPWASGWDSGNLRSVSGGAGWIMSADQVLSVMAHFRHTDSIVPRSVAQQAMDDRLGLDVRTSTPAGTLYNKNGLWRDGSGRTEQSLAYFLPNGMELVVMTNSPITTDGVFFRSLVTNLYLANLD